MLFYHIAEKKSTGLCKKIAKQSSAFFPYRQKLYYFVNENGIMIFLFVIDIFSLWVYNLVNQQMQSFSDFKYTYSNGTKVR